ncbi:MAG: hypothetical protein ABIO46_01960 [Chitinophagales bacterium]
MKQILTLSFIVMFLNSCNNNSTETTTIPVAEEEKKNEPVNGCYVYTSGKDNINLHIQISGNLVSGNLAYNFFEKDKNTGTIQGELKGDTVFADYKFMSEGKESTREVAFLKKGDYFSEGHGKVNATTGQPDFTDKASIKFEGNVILKKTDCNTDGHGCITLFGTVWSDLKNNCVELSTTATRLNPIEMKDKGKSPAFIIFSDDQSQAELYLPENNNAVILERKGKEGSRYWQYQDLKLIQWKGYVLKKGNLAIYGGM